MTATLTTPVDQLQARDANTAGPFCYEIDLNTADERTPIVGTRGYTDLLVQVTNNDSTATLHVVTVEYSVDGATWRAAGTIGPGADISGYDVTRYPMVRARVSTVAGGSADGRVSFYLEAHNT